MLLSTGSGSDIIGGMPLSVITEPGADSGRSSGDNIYKSNPSK